MRTQTHSLLCDTEIAPDGAVVVIEDVGAHGIPGTYVHPDIDHDPPLPCHALWVHTMNIDECAVAGRLVRVRVLTGTDPRGLGILAFEGQLEIASGVLAVGDAHNPGRQLMFGAPAILSISVLVDNQIDVICFPDASGDYPVSGPSEVTVLLHSNPGFTPAIVNTVMRGPRWLWPSRRYGRSHTSTG